jgi:hypothetical protein
MRKEMISTEKPKQNEPSPANETRLPTYVIVVAVNPQLREHNPDIPLSVDEVVQRLGTHPREPEPDREAEP